VIHADRSDLDEYRWRFAVRAKARTLAEALKDADVFVGLSVGGIVTGEMLKGMAKRPIVFALANPIRDHAGGGPQGAQRRDHRYRTVGLPQPGEQRAGLPVHLSRALDVRAKKINEEMEMAATRALAALAKEEVPDSVMRAYGLERLRFGPDYLIPKPFDPRVLLWVAPAVAWAAVGSGVAGRVIDVDEYRAELDARLGRAREVMRGLSNRAQTAAQRIVFPEGEDPRILKAARILADDGVAEPIVLGDPDAIRREADDAGVTLEDITLANPRGSVHLETFAQELWERRRRKASPCARPATGWSTPVHALLMLRAGQADAVVVGVDMYYPDAMRPGARGDRRRTRAPARERHLHARIAAADVLLRRLHREHRSDAETLAEIASRLPSSSGGWGSSLAWRCSRSRTFGSVRHPAAEKVQRAVALLHEREPALQADGEMQADTAVVERILTKTIRSPGCADRPTCSFFPNLDAANISYKLLSRVGGAEAIGPILVGWHSLCMCSSGAPT